MWLFGECPRRFLEKLRGCHGWVQIRAGHAREGRTAHREPTYWASLGQSIANVEAVVFVAVLADILENVADFIGQAEGICKSPFGKVTAFDRVCNGGLAIPNPLGEWFMHFYKM